MNNSSKACFILLCLIGALFLLVEYYEIAKKSLLQVRIPMFGRNTAIEVGEVNYDVWRWMSGYLVDDMRLWWNFPKYPEERKTLTTLTVSYSEVAGGSNLKGKYAHKIYGFLLPPKSGAYTFEIYVLKVSCRCEVEFWISSSMDPMEIKRVVTFEHGQPLVSSSLSAVSKPVLLSNQSPHYFEFFEKAFDGAVTVEIRWKYPGSEHFVTIHSSFLSPAIRWDILDSANMSIILNGNLPSNQLQSHHRVSEVSSYYGRVTDMRILPQCDYTAKYAYEHYVPRYTGIKEVFYSSVYPSDPSTILSAGEDTRGSNPVIEKKLAEHVIHLYGKALKRQYPTAAAKLLKMEETKNMEEGSRFLVEMEIRMGKKAEVKYTSEYLYLRTKTEELCALSNFKWNADARIYLVVATKNIGKWAQQLIYNIEQIYNTTKDDNFDLVFVDYESTDVNLMDAINSSSFKRYHIITLNGNFSRAGGLQAALQYITDPNSIVMTMDLHLYIPVGFLNFIRKHVIQGKMAYAPVLVRLGKGYSEVNIHGYWETFGYGIYGLYKSDWTAIGGYNITQYKYTWGGEDYDIVDKSRAMGYEVFRLRYPGFVHYFHTYGELWDSKKTK